MNKIDFTIITLKEMSLCTKHQKIKWSIDNCNIIMDIVYGEVKAMRNTK